MLHLAGIRTPRQVPKVTSERLQVRLAMRFRVCCHENEVCGKHTAPPDPRTGQSMGQRDASMGMTGTQNGTFPYSCRVASPLPAPFSESGTAWELWRFPQTAFSWQIWEKAIAGVTRRPRDHERPTNQRGWPGPNQSLRRANQPERTARRYAPSLEPERIPCRITAPKTPASICWNSVPIMTGNTTSPGKNCAAITAPAEMLRMPTPKHIVT